eukprot:TRINITY_DN2255_c0_g1_i1.p1 TRINITY_DN2255_c0_g1~~TRINITY_DN2255_c0_g1_i1.p1  ORF type:complete len:1253 (-),score=208.03 TRINITY_DN2255_c0_g1_i1:335-4093(-)
MMSRHAPAAGLVRPGSSPVVRLGREVSVGASPKWAAPARKQRPLSATRPAGLGARSDLSKGTTKVHSPMLDMVRGAAGRQKTWAPAGVRPGSAGGGQHSLRHSIQCLPSSTDRPVRPQSAPTVSSADHTENGTSLPFRDSEAFGRSEPPLRSSAALRPVATDRTARPQSATGRPAPVVGRSEDSVSSPIRAPRSAPRPLGPTSRPARPQSAIGVRFTGGRPENTGPVLAHLGDDNELASIRQDTLVPPAVPDSAKSTRAPNTTLTSSGEQVSKTSPSSPSSAWTAGRGCLGAECFGEPGGAYHSLRQQLYDSHVSASPVSDEHSESETSVENVDPLPAGKLIVTTKQGNQWVTADFGVLTPWQLQGDSYVFARTKMPATPKQKCIIRGIPKIADPIGVEQLRPQAVKERCPKAASPEPVTETAAWSRDVLSSLRSTQASKSADQLLGIDFAFVGKTYTDLSLGDDIAEAPQVESAQDSRIISECWSRAGSKQSNSAFAGEVSMETRNTTSQSMTMARSRQASKCSLGAPTAAEDEQLDDLLLQMKRDPAMDGFTDEENSQMLSGFKRFQVPGTNDVYKDDVVELLKFLGCIFLDKNAIAQQVKETTPYDYMDFGDFQSFMVKYHGYCSKQYRVVFERFDEDNSGEISIEELRPLIDMLGYMPSHRMVEEALEIVDRDGSGSLDVDELICFLAIYNRYQGFCKAEVSELRLVHRKNSTTEDPPLLEVEDLVTCLVDFFGAQVGDFAKGLVDRMQKGLVLRSSQMSESDGGEPKKLPFMEFLIFCRMCKEHMYKSLHRFWPKQHSRLTSRRASLRQAPQRSHQSFAFDAKTREGGVSDTQLRDILKQMKYTPLQSVMFEVYQDSTGETVPSRDLDYNEFFDFVTIYRQRSGFTKEELVKLRELFEETDLDGSGDINTLELGDLFRMRGYRVTVDALTGYLLEVDEDQSGELSWMEFLMLMGLHRQGELLLIKEAFDAHAEKGRLKEDQVMPAVQSIRHEVIESSSRLQGSMNFEEFVDYVDRCRYERVQRDRRLAGYAPAKIAELEEMFHYFDVDGGGTIDPAEMIQLLDSPKIKRAPRTKKEQEELLKTLKVAKQKALEAGVEEVADEGPGEIGFWSFVQLMRLLQQHQEQLEDQRLRSLMTELKFSKNEVDQFRQIFVYYAKYQLTGVWATPGSESADLEIDLTTHHLNLDVTCRIFRSVGVSLIGKHMHVLLDALDKLAPGRQVNFHAFMRLMRWAIDHDFAGVGSLVPRK